MSLQPLSIDPAPGLKVSSSQVAGSIWRGRVVTVLTDFALALPTYTLGAMWGGILIVNSASLFSSIAKLMVTLQSDTEDFLHTANKAVLRTVRDITNLVGSIGHGLEWTHQVKWINWSGAAPIVMRCIGYSGSLVGAGVDMASKTVDLILIRNYMHSKKTSDLKKHQLGEHQNACLIDIAASVATVVWSALGVLGLFVTNPVVPTLFGVALATGVGISLASYFYKRQIESAHAKIPTHRCELFA